MNWLGKLFGRKAPTPPSAPEDRRGWNEDWQVGDLAVCLKANWSPSADYDPHVGDVLRVSGLSEGKSMEGAALISALKFEGKPQEIGFDCKSFRKIRPEATAEEVETGIIATIKDAAKRGKVAA